MTPHEGASFGGDTTKVRNQMENTAASDNNQDTIKRNLRTFYTLVITQTFSLMGSRISNLAIGIWVFNQTGNATPLALVAFFTVLPGVLVANVSGMVADRWNRRYVMMLADAGQSLGTVALLISFLSGNFQLWHLYLITFIEATFTAFQGPAFTASITMLVPDSHRDRANTVQQLTGPMAGIIAPAIAGVIFGLVGVIGAIAIDLLSFIVAIAVLLRVRIPQPARTQEGDAASGNILKEMLGGLSYLWQRQTLFLLVMYFTLVNFLLGMGSGLTTPYLLARVEDEAIMGLLLSILNGGALVGGILFGMWGGGKGVRMRMMLGGAVMLGICFALMGMAQSVPVLALVMFFVLFPSPMMNASMMSMMQAKIPPDLQGRVFAVLFQLSALMMPLAFLIVGPLADQVFEPAVSGAGWNVIAPLVGDSFGAGMGMIIFLAGAITAITAVMVYAVPRIRNLEADLPDYVPVVAGAETSAPVPAAGSGDSAAGAVTPSPARID